jgi:hypothetical protein
MRTINRALLVVCPKGPYVDWANSNNDVGEPVSAEHFAQERTAFLVREVDDADHEEHTLQECYARIFEYELAEWSTDPDCWPKQRDLRS